MFNVFQNVKVYPAGWEPIENREFTQEEKDMFTSNEVVSGDYGLSVKFVLKAGGSCFIPLARDSKATLGSSIDVNKARVITLRRKAGEQYTFINKIFA